MGKKPYQYILFDSEELHHEKELGFGYETHTRLYIKRAGILAKQFPIKVNF